jgi:hypothetical protein
MGSELVASEFELLVLVTSSTTGGVDEASALGDEFALSRFLDFQNS